jgi:H+/Cl- antiporter ClcA
MLSLLASDAYTKLPASHWHLSLSSLLIILALLACGFGTTYLFNLTHRLLESLNKKSWDRGWLIHGIVAGGVLSALYLIGGPLIEFTGNESIVPMLHKAASLGIFGLLGLFVVKVAAISWSKGMGYRGGMVFPTIFVASVLVATAQQIDKNISFNIGLLVTIAGIIAANKKLKILF